MNDLISVIVPVYNVEKYLDKCVQSIINQTYTNIEIILVDDGSKDSCSQICDKWEKIDSRIKVIHKENGGLSSARNAGLDIAKGEYIGFVDSDDFIEDIMYEYLLKSIYDNSCLLSTCNINYAFENGKIIKKSNNSTDQVFDFYNAMIEMNTYRLFDMAAWNKLYHRKLFEGIRFPEGKLSEDYFIMYKLFEKAQKVSYVSMPCYNYLQRKNSITKNKKINHDFEEAAKEQMEFLDENYPELSTLGHVAHASSALTVYDFYIKNKVKCPKEKIEYFSNIVRENYKYILEADFLSKSKIIQFKLYKFSPKIYTIIFKIYRKFKRV